MASQIYTQKPLLAFIVMFSLCYEAVWSCHCNVAPLNELGIEDGHIPDQSMTASSRLDGNHGAARGRLNQGPTGSQGTAWCAGETNSDQYLQIDLTPTNKVGSIDPSKFYPSRVTHVATQGMNDPPKVVNGSDITSWVIGYTLQYSSDGKTYNGYYSKKDLKIFDGNKDGSSISCCELPYPIVVQYLRFRPTCWEDKICLRVGVYGIGNVTAHTVTTSDEIAVRHYWWWPLLWVLIIFLIFLILMACCCYCRIRKSLTLRPRPSKKTENKRPSFYTNPVAPHSTSNNGQITIAMEEMQEGSKPEGGYEEPEDEVQEVVAHFTDDGFSNKHGVTHFSVEDEDEDESPAAQPDKNRNRRIRSQEIPEEPNKGASVGAENKPRRGPSQHIYEAIK